MPVEFPFGAGSVRLADDGSVAAVQHPTRGHSVLLAEDGTGPEAALHDAQHRWGKGFAIVDGHGVRFDTPTELTWLPTGVHASYPLGPLSLSVHRTVGRRWVESYEVRNPTGHSVDVGCFAISTPWRDLYGSSRDCLDRAVHAHVWTGGADSWVWAAPMDGSGPGLGLQVTEGELWAYSIESRDQFTSSNVRGHVYLHTTDRQRAPHAFGGQPTVSVPAGGAVRLTWELAWFPTLADRHAAYPPMVRVDEVTAEVGRPIEVDPASDVTLHDPDPSGPGLRYVDATRAGRRSRIALYQYPPLRELTEARVRFALDRQRAPERGGSRAAAFLPYDTGTGLTVLPAAWADWNDVRERVGTALLLQEARRRGWGEAGELDTAIADYHRFVVEHVVRPDGAVRDDIDRGAKERLYNAPWFARFLLDAGDLDTAALVMEHYYDAGGEHFLAFELGGVITDVAAALDAAGRSARADRLRRRLVAHARTFVGYGRDLPAHEVNYEQSIVAPLLDLLLAVHRLDPTAVPAEELTARLPWLTAFAADQPDARLRHIPIRHWDGYWFGIRRMWGDVFPHYWSILSAAVYLAWPAELGGAAMAARGRAVLRANLINFHADGSATCAFVYPSSVNGRPAHVADPLVNDQDWALVYALRWL